MTGAALSAPLIFSLESCKSEPISDVGNRKLHHFNQDEMDLIKHIVDTILPKTDSPSASAVGVHHTIDQMVGQVYKLKDKKSYASNFAKLSEHLNNATEGKGFDKVSAKEKLNLLNALSKSNKAIESDAKNGYMALKQQTIAYYLNTEEIATKYLNYLPVPGQYEGCITLESVGGKAWAI